jgi:broad specificity phosphatase PhoE
VKFDRILCSSLNRAKETLNEVLKQSNTINDQQKKEVRYEEKLIERTHGDFDGSKWAYEHQIAKVSF